MDYLQKNKVEQALISKGVKNGDTVKLLDYEFTYHAN
jgi:Obg family GTPase CgtA-like protein